MDVKFVASCKTGKFKEPFENLKVGLNNGEYRIAFQNSTHLFFTCGKQDNNVYFNVCNIAETDNISEQSFEEVAYNYRLKSALQFYITNPDIKILQLLVLSNSSNRDEFRNVNAFSALKCIELMFEVSLVDILIAKYKFENKEELSQNMDRLTKIEINDIGDELQIKRKNKFGKKQKN